MTRLSSYSPKRNKIRCHFQQSHARWTTVSNDREVVSAIRRCEMWSCIWEKHPHFLFPSSKQRHRSFWNVSLFFHISIKPKSTPSDEITSAKYLLIDNVITKHESDSANNRIPGRNKGKLLSCAPLRSLKAAKKSAPGSLFCWFCFSRRRL